MNAWAVVIGLLVGLSAGIAVSIPSRPRPWHLALAVAAAAVIAALATGAVT